MPPPETVEHHPSQLGAYDVVSKIAEGGMGTVYKGRDRRTGELVAIKVISPGTNRNPVVLQRFEREFTAARVLEHPNVVRAIEYCGTGPHPFLVMEFVDGESIGQRVERAGIVPEDEAVKLIGQVCDGLQRAHKQGLIHRDVKPDNVLITRDGVAKLTDMGLVKDVEGDTNLTKTGRGLGTPHYMAPEQFRNAKGVDARGDVYSLGATLYCMVTGVVPFAQSNPLDCWMKKIRNEFPPPKELNPKLSDRVDWAIRRAMSADPASRPASCREFYEDLTGQSRGSGPVKTGAVAAAADTWYMVYRDETDKAHTVKGTTQSIRDALRDNLLGDPNAILVGRTKTGQFVPLASAPEFRDLVVGPAALGPDGKPSGVQPRRGATLPTPRPTNDSTNNDGVDFGAPPARGGQASGRYRQASAPPESGRYVAPPSATPTKPAKPPKPPADGGAKKPFDWTTPALMAVVAVLTGVVGYLMLTR